MEKIFLAILNMSITAVWVIIAVLILRLVLRNVPKRIHCLLWALVAIRLVCPFSFESSFSLIPSTETVSEDIMYEKTPHISTGIPALNNSVNPVIASEFSPNLGDSVNPMQVVIFVMTVIWLIGLGVMFGYACCNFIYLKYRLKTAVPLHDNVRQSEWVKSPFILGIIKPKIYLSYTMEEENRAFVIAHENAHLRRFDHISKPLAFLVLCIHWFNPVVWVAYIMFCRDIELACDETVIKSMEKEARRAYSKALVESSLSGKLMMVCPLAFGEVGVKTRVKRVMHYKKPTIIAIGVAVVACIVVAICLMTNPKVSYAVIDTEYIEKLKQDNSGIEVISGDTGYTLLGQDIDDRISELLENIRISSEPVSNNRSEERDRTNRIIFKKAQGAEYTMCFNKECTEVWFDDGVKPTYTYEVINPEYVRELFVVPKGRLTIDRVITLAGQKGEKLTWSDFAMYESTDIGSGLYILLYAIDENYTLAIGGGSMETSPMYMHLSYIHGEADFIDIRYEDVEAFVRSHNINKGEVSIENSETQKVENIVDEVPTDDTLNDLWIYNSSQVPTDVVRSAIDNQKQKEYTLNVEVRKVVVDDKASETARQRYVGSELAKGKGWTDTYLVNNMIVVFAEYYVEYDHNKTFLEDGEIKQYFILLRNEDTLEWDIWTNTTNGAPFH
ncbi:MAG: hypothetical protein IJW18_05390 [Lachnospiraceae bacterium]|nr:hypothetical protein [Lachnospiraceae bacterium]